MTVKELKDILNKFKDNDTVWSRYYGCDTEFSDEDIYYDDYNHCVVIETQ